MTTRNYSLYEEGPGVKRLLGRVVTRSMRVDSVRHLSIACSVARIWLVGRSGSPTRKRAVYAARE